MTIVNNIAYLKVAKRVNLKILITRKKSVTMCGDGYELDLLWSFHNMYKCQLYLTKKERTIS